MVRGASTGPFAVFAVSPSSPSAFSSGARSPARAVDAVLVEEEHVEDRQLALVVLAHQPILEVALERLLEVVGEAAISPARDEQTDERAVVALHGHARHPFAIGPLRIGHAGELSLRRDVGLAGERLLQIGIGADEVLAGHRVLFEVVADRDALVVGEGEERRLGDSEIRHLLAHLEERRADLRRVLLRVELLRVGLLGEVRGHPLAALGEAAVDLGDVLLGELDEHLHVGARFLGADLALVLAAGAEQDGGRETKDGEPCEHAPTTEHHDGRAYDESPRRESTRASNRGRPAAILLTKPRSPKWRNGRRSGFKIRRTKVREGSSPSFGTENASASKFPCCPGARAGTPTQGGLRD